MLIIQEAKEHINLELASDNYYGCYVDCSCDTDTVLPEDCNKG